MELILKESIRVNDVHEDLYKSFIDSNVQEKISWGDSNFEELGVDVADLAGAGVAFVVEDYVVGAHHFFFGT